MDAHIRDSIASDVLRDVGLAITDISASLGYAVKTTPHGFGFAVAWVWSWLCTIVIFAPLIVFAAIKPLGQKVMFVGFWCLGALRTAT